MTETNNFLLTEGLGLKVRGDVPWKSTFIDYFGDVNEIDPKKETSSTLSINLSENINLKNSKSSTHPDLYWSNEKFTDTRYKSLIDLKENSITLSQFGTDWVMWLIQLACLKQDHSLCHCAAVEKNGNAVIFPSWGGVGKTTIAASLVRDHGWNLLGDDKNFISADGNVYGFPKEMVIYPYHKEVFPEIFERGEGPPLPKAFTSPIGTLYNRIRPLLRQFPELYYRLRQLNPQSIKIKPSSVFSRDQISKKASIEAVIWLDRLPETKDVEFKKTIKNLTSNILGSTMTDFDQHCVELTNVAMGLNLIESDLVYSRWHEIIQKFLSDASTYELYLPSQMESQLVSQNVANLLEDNDIINK